MPKTIQAESETTSNPTLTANQESKAEVKLEKTIVNQENNLSLANKYGNQLFKQHLSSSRLEIVC